MKVSIREFTRNPYKYLKDVREELIITKGDKPAFILNVATNSNVATQKKENVATIPPKRIVSEESKEKFKLVDFYLAYGCGCKKGDTVTCPKHHRL